MLNTMNTKGKKDICKNIISICTTKNEADVIESFVRHTMTFSDVLIICNHMSVDNTKEILIALQKEGLNIIIKDCDDIGYEQNRIMTKLMYEAFDDYDADIVLPLDSDEFLLRKDNDYNIRNELENLSINENYYNLEWFLFTIDKNDHNTNDFILSRKCIRDQKPDKYHKKIIMKKSVESRNAILSIGNHDLFNIEEKNIYAKNLYIAHYPYRSHEQYTSKVCVGWMNTVARYSKYTCIANNWAQKVQMLFDENVIPEKCIDIGENIDIEYDKNITLKYCAKTNNAIKNIMKTAIDISNAYAVSKNISYYNKISVIIFIDNDINQCIKTVESICSQTYNNYEIILINLTNDSTIIQTIYKTYQNYNIKFYNGKNKIEYYNFIESNIYGNYIQILMSGDVIRNDKFKLSVLALRDHDKHHNQDVVYCDSRNINVRRLCPELKLYNIVSTRFLIGKIESTRNIPSGGIGGFMFTKDIFMNTKYLIDAVGNSFDENTAVYILLNTLDKIGVIQETMITRR